MTTFAQSIMAASPMTSVTSRSTRVHQFVPAMYAPRLQVRCKVKEDKEQSPTTSPTSPTIRQPKVSTKFSDVFSFGGAAPERINGRLAMTGFVAAMAVELANGQNVLDQISNGGVGWFIGTSVVLSFASLIPLFKGISVESKSDGFFFTSDAEMWNGRLAMLGLVALAFTEFVKGGSLV